ncbi:MAG TPA: DUF1707 domain-containing protein [Pseudonocardiaceae bacterium]|nr:DUF1707 domain-containing protein [Pseudonocardiaceae bacterium]
MALDATVVGVTGEVEPRDLRVSDVEREYVGELLQRAVGQGRLTVAEFVERMDAAMAARTRGELNTVLVDLPGFALVRSPVHDVLELTHHLGELTRRGPWTVPPRVRLTGYFGSSLLDFTEAVFSGPTVHLELAKTVGSTRIIIPDGATVDTDGLRVTAGRIKDSTVRRIVPGPLHFVITGRSTMGEIHIRHPRRWGVGPLTVHCPFRLSWGRRR